MQTRDLTFTNADGLKIHALAFGPDAPRAVIVLVHGYGEHHGRYSHVITALNDAGYAVYTLDHRGHGRSEGLRAHFDSFDQPIVDLKRIVERARADYPARKLFMLGHSMGALITLAFCIRHPEGLSGAIVSGSPVLADANVSKALVIAGKLLSRLIPKVALMPLVPLTMLSRDPAVIRAFEADPLTYKGNLRVRLGTELNNTAGFVRRNIHRLALPLLILHGESDRLVNPIGSQYLYDHAPAADKTYKTYPGLYHEILNEPEREQVLADILAWLNART